MFHLSPTALLPARYWTVSIRVNEVFYSLQGEGMHTGRAAAFIRLSGCNLYCPWCDTRHQDYMPWSPMNLVSWVVGHNPRLIVLTGGEPTVQAVGLYGFLACLWRACQLENNRLDVAVETNGLRLAVLQRLRKDFHVWITVSPKVERHYWKSLELADEVKVVWDRRWDLDELARHVPRRLWDRQRCFLQPCSGDVEPVVEYVQKHPEWRLSLQTQKILNIK
jgi:7-carboxy-7-deazaguanine synthase